MKTHSLSLSRLLRAFILSSCTAEAESGRKREREESKYKIKSRPASCSAHFVVLCDMMQVQATGWGDVMTAGF